jgi:uncharacterized protein YggE
LNRLGTLKGFLQEGVLIFGLIFLVQVLPLPAQTYILESEPGIPPGVTVLEQNHQIRIREVGVVPVKPDILYLLMKVTSERGQLSQAMEENRKNVTAFMDALKKLGIQESAIRLKNFVVLPVEGGPGYSFSRNLVIGLEGLAARPAEEITQLVAKVQDLGAQYGSDCITCIGSG